VTIEEILESAKRGQKQAKSIVDGAVDYLTMAIANLSVAFDPELIVLRGGITQLADMLLDPISSRIQGIIPSPPRLVVSDLGLRATVLGAVVTVLHNTSNFYMVHKLS
jgi:glucokinase